MINRALETWMYEADILAYQDESFLCEMKHLAIKYGAINLTSAYSDLRSLLEIIKEAKHANGTRFNQYSISWRLPDQGDVNPEELERGHDLG